MSKYIDINTGEEYNEIPNGKILPIIINGLPVTEQAYDNYYNEHPTELPEYIVSPSKLKSTTMLAYYDKVADATPSNLIRHVNSQYNDKRIRQANHWSGIANMFAPSLYVGAAFDYFQGEQPFWRGLWYGNSGWVPDNFSLLYPKTSMLINAGTDAALAHGINKIYNWGTTPKLIGEGANKKAYSAPFSRKVYFEGADPEYIQVLNKIPGSLKYKLEKYDIDGKPIYSLPKVRMISKPGKGIIKRMINNLFFPTQVAGDTEIVFINPLLQLIMLDTEWGKNFLGRTYVVDPEILSVPEYFSILKKGGKLNE